MGQLWRPYHVVGPGSTWVLVPIGMVKPAVSCVSRTIGPGISFSAFYLQFLIIVAALTLVRGQCGYRECSNQYRDDVHHVARPSPQACKAATRFRDCVTQIVPSTCRGDLNYHTTVSLIPGLLEKDCEGVGSEGSTPKTPPPPARDSEICRYQPGESSTFRHCGLFGDPHLRTFGDEFQTCKAAGAWPLIYNDFLAVQVTNVPLTHGQGATATSKLKIIIKESRPCTEKKMYDVTSGFLPMTFTDGSRRSGSAVHIERPRAEEDHVEIHMDHIATIVIVRQIGNYITFAIRMPEELIQSRGENDVQLCVRGCPLRERIDYADFLVQTRMEANAGGPEADFVSMRDEALAKCRTAGVIDVYLDSCIFDLITTGDSNFTKAAQSALSDMKRLNPEALSLLRNRTSVFERGNVVWRLIYGNSAPSRTFSWWFVLCAFLLSYCNISI